MPTCRFTVSTEVYDPKDKDFVCLSYSDGKSADFSKKQLSKPMQRFIPGKTPKKRGASVLSFVGEVAGKTVAVKHYRLDKFESTPSKEAKLMVSKALVEAKTLGCKRVVVILDGSSANIMTAVQEGTLLGGYKFTKYKKTPAKLLPVLLVCGAHSPAQVRSLLHQGKVTCEYANMARDVLNEPPNVIHPKSLAAFFETMGQEAGLKVSVWNEKKLVKEGCEGIVAVGKGSPSKPKLVIGEYKPEKAVCRLSLVGKGVTFDTGGYCLKPADAQADMKLDMAGAAMMFSAACAIARLKMPIDLTVYTPLVQNDISSSAYHTSDIITMRNGVSVQVDNTDAEGRLILADTLSIACDGYPDYLIDSATLTGACVVGLGEDICGFYSTDKDLACMLREAGEKVGEDNWELPLHAPYAKQLETEAADCKNIGSRWGGSITAALFLKKFVDEGVKWIHMDIAGPGTKIDALDHLGKGAKGVGVKTMVALAERLCR